MKIKRKIHTNKGLKGGLVGGKSHAENGTKAIIIDDSNKPIELEAGEAVVKKSALKDKTVKTLTGTNAQILNLINTRAGGNPIYAPSEVKMAKGGGVNTDIISPYLENLKINGIVLYDKDLIVLMYNTGSQKRNKNLYSPTILRKYLNDYSEEVVNQLTLDLAMEWYDLFDEKDIPKYLKHDRIIIVNNSQVVFDNQANMAKGGSIEDNCISFIKNSEAIKNNGYFHYFKNISIYADFGTKVPKTKSFYLCAYNSGGQKNLKVTDTLNLDLINKLQEIIDCEKSICRIIVDEFFRKAKRIESNDLSRMTGENIIVVDRYNIVCDNIKNEFSSGGSITPSAINNMTKAEQKAFYKTKEGKELDKQTYTKWKSLVNMSKGELESFYNSKEGKEAGLSASEAKAEGIDSGRESARWIMKMKDIPYTEWTSNMWVWAKKQISFVSRMKGMRGDLYDDKGNKTRKHLALLIWGHNPKKMAEGGVIPQQGTLFTKDKKNKLDYKKVGNDYVFKVYDVESNPVENYTRHQYKKRNNNEATMNYNQFINYLYSEHYIDDKKMAEGGNVGDSKLLAPNGKQSNLTAEQYKLVRTAAFKKWFGDWENDAENASKVVDDNGEPLVVYHFSRSDEYFYSFKNINSGGEIGIHFGNKEQAKKNVGDNNYIEFEVFINIRNPLLVEDIRFWNTDYIQENILIPNKIKYKKSKKGYMGSQYATEDDILESLADYKIDGFIYPNEYEGEGISYSVFYSNQIKLADGTNTTFDGSNADIRFAEGGVTGDVFSIKDPEQFKQLITLYNKFSEKFDVDNYFVDDSSVVFLRKVKFTDAELKGMAQYIADLSKNQNFSIISDKKPEISNGYFKFFLNERVRYRDGGNVGGGLDKIKWDFEFTGGVNKGKKLSDLEIDIIDVYDDYAYSLLFTDGSIYDALTKQTEGLLSITENVVKLSVILGDNIISKQKTLRRLQKLAEDSNRIIVENNNESRSEKRLYPFLLVSRKDAKNYVIAEQFKVKLDTPKKAMKKSIIQQAIDSGSFLDQIKKGRDAKGIIETILNNGLKVPNEILNYAHSVGETTFTDYKGEQIMYEPHNREYFVIGNDENIFKSMEDAKAFIDNPKSVIQTEYAKMVAAETNEVVKNEAKREGLQKVVLDEGNGIIINDLFNEWNNIKNEKQSAQWKDKIKNTKFGTYGTVGLMETIKRFNPKLNDTVKRMFYTEIEAALGIDKKQRTYKPYVFERPSLKETPQAGSVGVGGDVPQFAAKSDRYFEYVPIEEVDAYKEFDRETDIKFDKRELDYLTEDIRKNGIATPITIEVYNGKGLIVEGNHRLAAAKRLGIKNIPVRIIERSKDFGSINKEKAVKMPRSKGIDELKVFNPEIELKNIDNSPAKFGFTKVEQSLKETPQVGNVGNMAAAETKELQKGIKVEQEHEKTFKKVAKGKISVKDAIKETAEEHISENPNYYDELEKIEGSVGVGGDVPIRQLGTGANVYFETDKYRVNDNLYRVNDNLKSGKVLLNVGDAKGEIPLANIEFDTTSEAVFVAKKLQENAPEGLVSDYHNVDKIIENYKDEYKQSLKETPQAGSVGEITFTDYKGEQIMIMYEPHYKEYFVIGNDENIFNSLEDAKAFIDNPKSVIQTEYAKMARGEMDGEIRFAEGGSVDSNLKNALKDLESARSVKYWLEPEFSSEAYKYEQKGNSDSFVKIYDEKYNADTILAYNKRGNLVGLFSISKGGKEQGAFKIVVREDSMNQGWGKKLLDEAERQGIDVVGNIKNNSFTNGGRNLLRSWLGKKMKANN